MIDAYSRRIVGWAIDSRQTASLVLAALDMAIAARSPDRTVVHRDHGTQFTSWAFSRRITDAGLVGSMGTIGDGYDCQSLGAGSRKDRVVLAAAV